MLSRGSPPRSFHDVLHPIAFLLVASCVSLAPPVSGEGIDLAAVGDALQLNLDDLANLAGGDEEVSLEEVQALGEAIRTLTDLVAQATEDTPAGLRRALNESLSQAIASSDALTRKLDPVCFKYPSHRFGKNPITEMEGGKHENMLFEWSPMACWTGLSHPLVWLYAIHVVAHLITTVMAFYAPKALIGIMAASGLVYPLSALVNAIAGGKTGYIWTNKPWSFEWFMVFIKWIIVNGAAAIPILAVKEFDLSYERVQRVADFIYVILGANIIWTLFFKVNGWVRMVNFFVGLVLTIALGIEFFALKRAGKPLIDKINGIPYGRTTPLLWLVSYTIWNAIFVGDLNIGMTFQDCLFWGMMYMMQLVDPKPLTIDLYFAFARPLSLGIYIAISNWAGLFPYWRDAEEVEPLGINDDFYFLFLTCVNLIISFMVLAQAITEFRFGIAVRTPHRTLSMVERRDLKKRGSILPGQSRHQSVPVASFSFVDDQ